jgi:hypothetical protein
MGIDSPESRPAQNAPLRDLEKQAAAAVKERLRRWVEGQDVIVEILKHDKWGGRVVANVWHDNHEQRNIGQEMLRRQWVRPYNGERKLDWTTSELQHILISTST